MDKKEKLYDLLSLKLSGEATAIELLELEELIQSSPLSALEVEMIETVWKCKTNPEPAPGNYDKHLQRLSNHLSAPTLMYQTAPADTPVPSKRPSLYRRMILVATIAASITILIFTVSYLNTYSFSKQPLQNSVSTRPGSKSKIELPDGTQVWLNAGSKLTYNEDFLGDRREVSLCGEAYFDVVKDKDHPFIIHTDNIDIKVLGTAFNVRSYPSDKTTETSLIHGSVEITLHNNPGKTIILKPNEKLVVQNVFSKDSVMKKSAGSLDHPIDLAILSITNVQTLKNDTTTVETSWIRNMLAFDNEPLEDVARKIERWYDVDITIDDPDLKLETYSSVFQDESLTEVLEALKLTGNFTYTINRKHVIISK